MPDSSKLRANILGDLRAEADTAMLDHAFVETPDYRTLLESSDRTVVVGRRGTGKSALMYQLTKYWNGLKGTAVITIAPEEDQVIGMRPLIQMCGDKFTHLRAATRIGWKYALLLEITDHLASKYKFAPMLSECPVLSIHLKKWKAAGPDIFARLRGTFKRAISQSASPEERIGNLAINLELQEVQEALDKVLTAAKFQCVILIDKLDEGYDPDDVGVGFVDGVIYATIDINTKFEQIKTVLFLRDNIFRAVATKDPDFSRNIEGQVLRLHWDSYLLLNLVCNRLRRAFMLEIENNQRLWDRCTANELQHQDGFKKCLQLTLYRPRDLLILLNEAFFVAAKHDRKQIVLDDIEVTAKAISNHRLDDLQKEYEAIFPGISQVTSLFFGRNPEMKVSEASGLIAELLQRDDLTPKIQQEFAILSIPKDVLRALHSVGFLGVHDAQTATYIFCHDGKNPGKELNLDDRILVHPCYWLALNLTKNSLNPEEAEEIDDEYEIQIHSETPDIRIAKLGAAISNLEKIPLGRDGDSEFEQWCLEAAKIVFAGKLRNFELHPNKNAKQRRDVVATNTSDTGVWRRISEDYSTRQVIFEVKNFQGLGPDEYRQMLSYLNGPYGKLGFIITRDINTELTKEVELPWFLEMYNNHHVMIIKLTGKYLSTILSKLRSPQKHDAADTYLDNLLDTYSRLYLSNQTSIKKKKRK